ncbi:putative holin [Sodalis praecaptivus]|uniref:putative holin n=1 Tax=Sodalis TaxID=84565 RepID=UPI00046D0C1B
MSEPLTGSDLASALVKGAMLISVFGPQNGPTVIGAFAGAAIFVAISRGFWSVVAIISRQSVLCRRTGRSPFHHQFAGFISAGRYSD